MADKKGQRFTFDSEADGQEVPTLTSLLYRKKLVKTTGSPGAGAGRNSGYGQAEPSGIMTLEPTTTIERPLPEMVETPPSAAEPKTSVTLADPADVPVDLGLVRPDFGPSSGAPALGTLTGEPRARRTIPAKTPYKPPTLVKATTAGYYPETNIAASGLRMMLKKPKVNAALVFESAAPECFKLAHILQTPGTLVRSSVWSGMEFSVQDFSDLWGRLQKFGFAEFSTLGAAGAGNYDRLAFRSAFQAKSNEWVTLIRVKDSSGRECLAVFLSEVSIQAYIPTFQTEVLSGGASGGIALAA